MSNHARRSKPAAYWRHQPGWAKPHLGRPRTYEAAQLQMKWRDRIRQAARRMWGLQ